MRPSLWAVVVLVILVLVLFGARRLPDLASSIGASLKIFRRDMRELVDDDQPSSPAAPAAGSHERSNGVEDDAGADGRRAPP